ncbi:hypothetical protein PENSPDRAFT_689132 [Peniophora sp. CONT]|nr:hypothetical protein PENSPDRAFT_689132 [Peniophora sp. CONT]
MSTSGVSLSTSGLDEQFNAPDAEFILRSSNGIDFAVHKTILHLASPVFRDMLSLPQPSLLTDASSRTIISMTEDAPSLRLLLRFTYPRSFCDEPWLLTIDDIKRAATLSHKYEILFMRNAAELALIRFSTQHPDVSYAVAWRYKYLTALRASARRSLEPFVPSLDAPEFDDVPASAFMKLQRYKDAIPAALEGIAWVNRPGNVYHITRWIDRSTVFPPNAFPDIIEGIQCSCAPADVPWALVPLAALNLGEQEIMDLYMHGGPTAAIIIARSWWCAYVQDVVSAMKTPDRPSLDDALSRPMSTARAQADRCLRCRQLDVQGTLESTKEYLRAEIEKRLANIPIDAPFWKAGY